MSLELMEKDPQYRFSHEIENQWAETYAEKMKSKKDRQFLKSLIDTIDDLADKRRLYSEYDDNIYNEPVIRIPIVFHVLYSSDDENLSDE